MIAKIGIYKDCSSEEPTKEYICRRILYGVSKKAVAIAQNAEKMSTEEQEKAMVEMLQAIFPDFTAAELEYIDPNELDALIVSLQNDTAAEMGRVEKN